MSDGALAMLDGITELRGSLSISGVSVNALTLQCLEKITGTLSITDDTLLTRIDLSALTTVGSSDNALLFDALPNLASIDLRSLAETPANVGLTISHAGSTAKQPLTLDFSALRALGGTLYLVSLANLHDTSAFASLRSIGGRLCVQNDDTLATLNGFKALQTVAQDLFVYANVALTSIELPALTHAGGGGASVVMWVLPKLGTLSLPSLLTTDSGILLENIGATAATSLTVNFDALTSIGDSLYIARVANLVYLNSLAKLRTVQNRVYIVANTLLASAPGLASLRQIKRELDVHGNPALASLDLPSLESVGANIILQDDAALTTVDLIALTSIGVDNGQSIVVDALPNLIRLDVRSLSQTPSGGTISISNSGKAGVTPLALNFTALTAVGSYKLQTLATLRAVGVTTAFKKALQLIITDNPALTSFASLTGLTSLGGLTVTGNAALPTCQATLLRDRIKAGGGGLGTGSTVKISGNLADGCS